MKSNTNKQYAQALYQACQKFSGRKLQGIINEFVKLLAKDHKLKSVDQIIAEFIRYAKKQQGIVDIEIATARTLDKNVIEQIKKIFGKQTENTQKIDKNLLGGVKIKTGSLIFDGSLRMQLNKLSQTISGN